MIQSLTRLSALACASVAGLVMSGALVVPGAQAGQLPDDVHPVSRNRLPPVERTTLDPGRRATFDALVARDGAEAAVSGADALRLHGSGTNLRWSAPMGRLLTELTILATAREYDQLYEWALHEIEAIQIGMDAALIDIVRHRKPLVGLSERDAIVIEVARELFGTRRLSSDTYARALALLGQTNLVDVVDVMGRYASTAGSLSAFNQQMPAGWRQSLPLPFLPPDDIHPDSRSRLRLADPTTETSVSELYGRMLSPAGIGPGRIRNRGEGLETLERRVGSRLMHIAVLVTARAHDAQYDWTLHLPRARTAGVEDALIEVIRDGGSVEGLNRRDAALITFGRELWHDHNVTAETYARAVAAFGERELVDLVGLMGTHAADAALLAAFDQHLPEGTEPLLPVE